MKNSDDDVDVEFDLATLIEFGPTSDPLVYLRIERKVACKLLRALDHDLANDRSRQARRIGTQASALAKISQIARVSLGLPDAIPGGEAPRPAAIRFSVSLPQPPPSAENLPPLAPQLQQDEEPVVTVARRTGSGDGASSIELLLDRHFPRASGDDDDE